jgi:glycerol-3-phosphate acyltransferase PlsY
MPEFHFGPLQVFINDPFTALQGILGIMAILGHNFSIFLRFKGGKGVATSLGVVIALSPNIGLITATIWLLSFRRTGYSSLSSLISFGMLPLCIYGFDYSYEKFLTAIFIAALIFVRHVSNIKRLLAGTENKFLREKK